MTQPYALKPDRYSSHSVILAWLGEGRGRRLLDVGAAGGLLSGPLSARGWRVTALERDAAAARALDGTCERVVVADAEAGLPPLGGPFDAVLYGDVLEHLREPARVLREIGADLAAGGRVIVSVPNVAHLWIRLSLLAGRFEYADRGILDRTHLRFFTKRTLWELLRAGGLSPLRWTTTPAPLYQVVPERFHGAPLAAVHALSAAAARALPRLLAYQFVVEAEGAKAR